MASGSHGRATVLCVYVAIFALGSSGSEAQSTVAWLNSGPGATESGSEFESSESRSPEASSNPGASPPPDPTPGASPPPDPTPVASRPPSLTPLPGASPPSPEEAFGSARTANLSFPAEVTNVTSLCVCDLLVAQCDVNCCCDPDCSVSDFSVFSTCSISLVTGDSQLCSQTVSQYSMNMTKAIPERVVAYVAQVNPNVFCVQATNYQYALSFALPQDPTVDNFNSLVSQYKKGSFIAETGGTSAASGAGRYEYGAPIQTPQSFLTIPAPLVSSQCTDQNPAGFLLNQDVKCTRSLKVENCNISALTLSSYSNVSLLEAPNSSQMVPITVQSIMMTSLDGTFSNVNITYPVPQYNASTGVCTNVVLKGSYVITYTEAGLITNASASFVLGAINSTMVPLQQAFQVRFSQQNTNPIPLSGNPGYVVGQPVVAGFQPTGSGIIQSTNRYGQLTILQSSTNQDCLAVEGKRTPVLFGYNMVSGCKLRNSSSNCQVMAGTIKKVLMGQNFPQYVASFGNSQTQNVADWVSINRIPTAPQGTCQVPVSSEIVIKWKKYGSLVNPQAKIDNVTETTTYASLQAGTGSVYQISSLVTFLDISAPADPGYRAPPTIDAKLPFDFFYPFV